MKKILSASAIGGTLALTLQACGPAATPQQQAQRQHDIACMTGTVGGALIGGAIGRQFGGGRGRNILTAGGAVAGGAAGNRFAC